MIQVNISYYTLHNLAFLYCVWCRRPTPTFSRVAIVPKIDKDKEKIAYVEKHRPLHVLDANYGGLPSEDEIALANINKRKSEAEEKRKTAEKNRKPDNLKKLSVDRVTTTANDKENAKPSKKKK